MRQMGAPLVRELESVRTHTSRRLQCMERGNCHLWWDPSKPHTQFARDFTPNELHSIK